MLTLNDIFPSLNVVVPFKQYIYILIWRLIAWLSVVLNELKLFDILLHGIK